MRRYDISEIILGGLLAICCVSVILLLGWLVWLFIDEVFTPGLIDESFETVSVEIVDSNYQSSYSTPVMAGKVMTMAYHPARYEIIVLYNGIEYTVDDEAMYNKYKNSIGMIINGTLRTRTYKNGDTKTCITAIE